MHKKSRHRKIPVPAFAQLLKFPSKGEKTVHISFSHAPASCCCTKCTVPCILLPSSIMDGESTHRMCSIVPCLFRLFKQIFSYLLQADTLQPGLRNGAMAGDCRVNPIVSCVSLITKFNACLVEYSIQRNKVCLVLPRHFAHNLNAGI